MKLVYDPFDPYFLKPTVPHAKQVLRNAIRKHTRARLNRIAKVTGIPIAKLKAFKNTTDLATPDLQTLAKTLVHAEYDEEHNLLVSYPHK